MGETLLIETHQEAMSVLGQKVRIIGVAQNAKLSAVVTTDRLTVYCIERAAWGKEFLGRKVEVSGLLEETDQFNARRGEDGVISQGTKRSVLVLRSMTYKRVE